MTDDMNAQRDNPDDRLIRLKSDLERRLDQVERDLADRLDCLELAFQAHDAAEACCACLAARANDRILDPATPEPAVEDPMSTVSSAGTSTGALAANKDNEKVLCVPAAPVGNFAPNPGLNEASETHVRSLLARRGVFRSRVLCEDDTVWLQVIPYCLVRHGDHVLAYMRRGGDDRLGGRVSIGWGGHVNDRSARQRTYGYPFNHVIAGADRELREEIVEFSIDGSYPDEAEGDSLYRQRARYWWLNDLADDEVPANSRWQVPVGKVHIGLVFEYEHVGDGQPPQHTSEDPGIGGMAWLTRDMVAAYGDRLERWSRILVEHDDLWNTRGS